MPDSDPPYVFAAIRVINVETIDGGRTLAVRLQKADGEGAVVLLSLPLAQDLSSQLTCVLDAAPAGAQGR